MGLLISVVGVHLYTYLYSTHNSGRLPFRKTSKGQIAPGSLPLHIAFEVPRRDVKCGHFLLFDTLTQTRGNLRIVGDL